MASPNFHSNGVGGTTGATLTTVSPLLTSGNIYYVSSASGSNSNTGLERNKPLATLAQAYTNASANDTIVLMSGHTQSIVAVQTLAKAGLTIVGEGSGSSRPQFTRLNTGASFVLFDITAAGVTLSNLYFQDTSGAACTDSKVKSAAANTLIDGCYFEAGVYDTGPQVEYVTGASQARIRDTTFISVGTSGTQPESAVKVTNALTDLELDTVVFDGGTIGWSNPYALNGAAAITRLRGINLSLLDDSDITLATGTTGYLHVLNKSGSARVVWTA
jgi:hypothetical protein